MKIWNGLWYKSIGASQEVASKSRGVSLGIFYNYRIRAMNELVIIVDESVDSNAWMWRLT